MSRAYFIERRRAIRIEEKALTAYLDGKIDEHARDVEIHRAAVTHLRALDALLQEEEAEPRDLGAATTMFITSQS